MRSPHTSFLERLFGGFLCGVVVGFFAYLIYCVVVAIGTNLIG